MLAAIGESLEGDGKEVQVEEIQTQEIKTNPNAQSPNWSNQACACSGMSFIVPIRPNASQSTIRQCEPQTQETAQKTQ